MKDQMKKKLPSPRLTTPQDLESTIKSVNLGRPEPKTVSAQRKPWIVVDKSSDQFNEKAVALYFPNLTEALQYIINDLEANGQDVASAFDKGVQSFGFELRQVSK